MLNVPSLIPLEKCVSINSENAQLYLHNDHREDNLLHSTGSSLEYRKWNVDHLNSLSCESIDIVSFILSIGKPIDILKVDIEGHEIKLLQHIAKYPSACALIKSCYVELHHKKFKEFELETEQLINYFDTFTPFPINFNWH